MGLVWGVGLGHLGAIALGFGFELKVEDLGSSIEGLEFEVWGLGLGHLGALALGFGFEFRVEGLDFSVEG